jgi:hypothetical protein
MTCAEYWESQGADALDAATAAGCPTATGSSGHDVIGGFIFLASIITVCVLVNLKRTAPPS